MTAIRLAAACALIGAVWPAWAADTEASAWTYESVAASPRWIDFGRRLRDSFWQPVDDSVPPRVCRKALEAGTRKADAVPVDICIESVLRALEPGSSYVSPKQLAESAPGRGYVGIGLEMGAVGRREGEPVTVVAPIIGGPAARAGMRAGDLIVAIDGTDVRPLTIDAVVKLMRGPAGSTIEVDLLRGTAREPLRFTMAREEIRLAYVRGGPRGDAAVYLRVSRLIDESVAQLIRKANELSTSGGDRRAIVLDLRTNSGGTLAATKAMAALFSPEGSPVMGIVSRSGTEQVVASLPAAEAMPRLSEAARRWLQTSPLVVLVDHRTGSGAEAVAQVLREQRGAVLIGQKTFGDGLVRERLGIGGDAAVVLAISEMVSPARVSWQGTGLSVDEEVIDVRGMEFGDPRDASVVRGLEILQARSR